MKKKKPNKKSKSEDGVLSVLHWAPRILLAGFGIFLSLFSFDVFEESWGTLEKILAFAIHLIPAALIFIFLAIAWKRPIIGGYIFLALGIIFGFFFEAFYSVAGFLVLVLPLWIVAILFLLDYYLNK